MTDVLGIFAHPDDESLLSGGTLAACSAAGLDCVVISLTRGELGPIAREHLATRETLPAVREAELRRAADALGLRDAVCLDYPDGELEWCEPAEVERDIAHIVRHHAPRMVITFGPEGLYWHPDHIAVHRAVTAVIGPSPRDGPSLYWSTIPEGFMADLARTARMRGLPHDLWGLDPHDVGGPEDGITTVVDVRHYLAAKMRALHYHATQIGPDHLLYRLPHDLAAAFLGCEFFTLAWPHGTRDRLASVIDGVSRAAPLAAGDIDF